MGTEEGAQERHDRAPEAPKLEHYLSLLNYHRSAMEDRRRIQIRTFVGMVVFYLVVLDGVVSVDPSPTHPITLKVAVTAAFVLAPFLFFGFLRQIERRNWSNQYFVYLPGEEST